MCFRLSGGAGGGRGGDVLVVELAAAVGEVLPLAWRSGGGSRGPVRSVFV